MSTPTISGLRAIASDRTLAMCARRAQGASLESIAKDYGITRERVRQLIKAAGGPSARTARAAKAARQNEADREDAERLRKLLRQHPALTLDELAELSGIAPARVRSLLGGDARMLVAHRRREQMYSDEDIFAAMRAAAAMFDKPLSHQRYAKVTHEVGGPSVPRILQRFNTWLQACERAGVRAGTRPDREYHRKWSPEDCMRWVAAYLASPGCPGTFHGYTVWARRTPGAPSSGTVRNTLGSWSDVKVAALVLVRAQDNCAA